MATWRKKMLAYVYLKVGQHAFVNGGKTTVHELRNTLADCPIWRDILTLLLCRGCISMILIGFVWRRDVKAEELKYYKIRPWSKFRSRGLDVLKYPPFSHSSRPALTCKESLCWAPFAVLHSWVTIKILSVFPSPRCSSQICQFSMLCWINTTTVRPTLNIFRSVILLL